jgi:hypothetical protein
MEECDAILERFDKKGLKICRKALIKAIMVPSDLPEQICLRNLPLPGASLHVNPSLAEKPMNAASKKVKGKKKKGKGKAKKKKK